MNKGNLTEQIRKEHLEVRRGLEAVEERLAARTSDGLFDAAAVAERLRGLRDHLRRHFEFEEVGGPLSSSVTRTSRQEARANELLHQHPEFLRRLEGLVERLSSGAMSADQAAPIVEDVRQLFRDLGEHESLENILFQEQVYDELGAGD